MLRRAAAVLIAITTAAMGLSACGSPHPPQARLAPAIAATALPATTDHDGGAPPKLAAHTEKTAADHHREFMTGCARKATNSPDYCECAWGELRKAFSDDEMSAGDLPSARLDKVKGQVLGACASKIPEENVRSDFAKACIGSKEELKPYCDCTWTEFRKRFSTAELSDEATVMGERFLTARGPVVKACGAKMPESVSKEAFMKGCMKDPSVDKFCGCAWKELRKQASPGEIEAATFDQKAIFSQVDKTCGKLRP